MISSINANLFPGFSDFRQIGRGAYGIVYLARNIKTGQQIAIKTVDKIDLMTESNRAVFHSEIRAYSQITHPFLPQFYCKLEDQAGVYIAIEAATNGTLLDYISQHGKLRENEAAKFFCELISAVKYLHENKIIHRDIKAENILLDKEFHVRLTDFGLSDVMKDDSSTFDIKCGSFPYSAPEMLKGQKYTKMVDIWACGVVLYIMVTGLYPFAGNSHKELFQQIMYSEPQFPSFLSPLLRDLIQSLLKKDPSERMTIDELEVHPWITNSRNCAYISSDFVNKSNRRYNPHEAPDVDLAIVSKLESFGVDTSNIIDDLLNAKFTEATTLYRIFSKQNVLNELQSPEEIRTMYGIRKRLNSHSKIQKIERPSQIYGRREGSDNSLSHTANPGSLTLRNMNKKQRTMRSSLALITLGTSNHSRQDSLPNLTPTPKTIKHPFL